jgi:hypothetical protein
MDDFKGGELGKDWTPVQWCVGDPEPDWKVKDGILMGRWPNWDAQMLFLPEYPSLDYTIQMKCRIDQVMGEPGLAGAGFIFRSSGPAVKVNGKCIGPLYELAIGHFQCGFMDADRNGNWFLAGIVVKNHDLEQWYTLKLVVKGDKFLGYVDGEPICQLSDNKYKGNFVGLMLGSNINASFDDFMITERVDEQALTDFDVLPADKLAIAWGYVKQK